MKKIVSIIAAVAMLCALSTTAFAQTTIGRGSDSHDVMAKYNGGVSTPDVYSVDVEWGAMEFTYNVGGTKDWNAADHSYADNSTASWTANGNTVTVTNHSNKEVTASFDFTALTDYSTVTGSFDCASAVLSSAVDKTLTDTTLTAASALTLLGTISDTLTDFTEIGSVTVTIQ